MLKKSWPFLSNTLARTKKLVDLKTLDERVKMIGPGGGGGHNNWGGSPLMGKQCGGLHWVEGSYNEGSICAGSKTDY